MLLRWSARSRFAGLLAAAFLVAACGGTDGGGAEGGDGTEAFEFAVVGELSGAFAQFGNQLRAGVELGVQDLNASGDYDFTLKPKFYDCQSEQAVCVNRVRQATATDKMPVVMGPVVSLNAIPSAEVTDQAGVPHIIMTVVPSLTQDHDNVFRFGAVNAVNVVAVTDYVKKHLPAGGAVAIVHANTEFGQGAKDAQVTRLAELGLEPAAVVGHDPEQADYTPVIVELRQVRADFVLLSTSNAADIAKLLRQARESGLESQWLSAQAPEVPSLAGEDAVGFMEVGPWFPSRTDPKTAELVKRLEERPDVETASWIAAMAYDATKGVAEAAKAKGTGARDILDGLNSLDGMQGAVTTWTFTPDNHEGMRDAFIARWDGRDYEIIWPE